MLKKKNYEPPMQETAQKLMKIYMERSIRTKQLTINELIIIYG